MYMTSKTTMNVEPLCGLFGNPLGGVTAIHTNQRKFKL